VVITGCVFISKLHCFTFTLSKCVLIVWIGQMVGLGSDTLLRLNLVM